MLNSARTSREDGVTLVELLVVVLILGVIGGFLTSSIVQALAATRQGEARVHALNDLQRGMERVGRELRAADPLLIESGEDPADGLGAEIVRNGERVTYRYYLVDMGDRAELREDVERRQLDGTLITSQDGLFIADIANLETGTPLFTYYVTDPTTGQLEEIDCSALTTIQCEQRHTTATQVQMSLSKLLPEQAPIQVDTVLNIRSVRLRS